MISNEARRIDEVKDWNSGEIYGIGELVSYQEDTYVVKRTTMASERAVPGTSPEFYELY